jgi:hypothetical protein
LKPEVKKNNPPYPEAPFSRRLGIPFKYKV